MRILTSAGDVEGAVIAALRAGLDPPVTVATGVARNADGTLRLPERMVRVSRSGGTVVSPAHDRPMILVEAYGATGPKAWALAGQARAVMLGLSDTLAGGLWLSYYAEISGPVNYEDPRTSWPRYQFIHQLTTKAAEQR